METTLPEEHVEAVDVSREEANWMCHFGRDVLKGEEIIRHLWWSSHFTGSLKTKYKKVKHQAIILDNERGKLEATNDAIRVGVVHVLHTATTSLITS